MEVIIHRVNNIKNLKKLRSDFGAEIDLRAKGSSIILNHDVSTNGDKFEDYIDLYNHGTLVLNIKESGIENEVIKIVKKKKIKKFFLLDVEVPYLFKALENSEKFSALRVSYYEPLEFVMKFKKIFNWFWLDSIKKLNFSDKEIKTLNNHNTCFVCPERWGRPHLIDYYKKYFQKRKLNINSVMTSLKYAEKWINNDKKT